jgi:hypothetical protein
MVFGRQTARLANWVGREVDSCGWRCRQSTRNEVIGVIRRR